MHIFSCHVARWAALSIALAGIAAALNVRGQDAVSAPVAAEAETGRVTIVGRVDDLIEIATTTSQGSVGATINERRPRRLGDYTTR